MPLPNLRVVILGRARADRAFQVVVVDRKEAQRLAEELARGTEEARREVERSVREIVRGV